MFITVFQVNFHNDKTEFVAEHVIRLPHDSQVGDVLRELSNRLGPDYADRKLRLLEVYHSKIFKVWTEVAQLLHMLCNCYFSVTLSLVTVGRQHPSC